MSEDGKIEPTRPRVLSVSINDARTLRAAFMPFLKNTGLFVPTNREYAMGDEVFLVLKLLGGEQFALAGTVVWITPSGAQSSRTKGVGVQFKGPEGGRLRDRIIELIGTQDQQQGATHTL
ncbi:MAG: PilZ domain-containing protein [Gammaproteobacteria bacterium]